MLLHVEFPIADLRNFSGERYLPRPNWYKEAIPDADFVRGVGIVRMRPSGGLSGWIGEDKCCDARCVVRMDMDEQRARGFLPFHADIRFRRFYSDGLALSKFDIGFDTRRAFSGDELLRYLGTVAALPIRVRVQPPLSWLTRARLQLRSRLGMRRGSHFARVPLIRAGAALAQFYAFTTTEHGTPVAMKRSVDAGSAAIFIEATKDELRPDDLPAAAKLVQLPASDFVLYHWWRTFLGCETPIWLCLRERGHKDDPVRNLRGYLLRLHAEHQVFVRVLNAYDKDTIDPKPRTPQGERFQEYLDRTSKRVLRVEAKTKKIADSNDLLATNTVISEQRRAELLDKLQKIVTRKNVYRQSAKSVGAIALGANPDIYVRSGIIEFIHGGLRWKISRKGRMTPKTSRTAAFIFGVTYVTVLLIVNLIIRSPSPTQYQTFRIILALAAGGVGSMIPGILQIDMKVGAKFALHAAGALALFVVVYFFSPGMPPSSP
jgi:hypothetical protein